MTIYLYTVDYSSQLKIYELEYEEKNKIYKLVSKSSRECFPKINLNKNEVENVTFSFKPEMYSLSNEKLDYFKEEIITHTQYTIDELLERITKNKRYIEKIKEATPIYFPNKK